MAETGETLLQEKYVRIKFHQSGLYYVVKFTPTGIFSSKLWYDLEIKICVQVLTHFDRFEGLFLFEGQKGVFWTFSKWLRIL